MSWFISLASFVLEFTHISTKEDGETQVMNSTVGKNHEFFEKIEKIDLIALID